ncbi:hypothetical protein ABID21_000861 [Pseudorhizobium tarimense]|uniref:Uncharacterized protein n=1 Tax=Pseudorhizobium tarimense TaxID=1079109 RepID=A0ABV2H2K1_9HYPH|nr:hypothetical protein [Pseudorhizobium tarimense]MCJ8518241.1 hypothetical protein [Pseudorhizobium tarimense]
MMLSPNTMHKQVDEEGGDLASFAASFCEAAHTAGAVEDPLQHCKIYRLKGANSVRHASNTKRWNLKRT